MGLSRMPVVRGALCSDSPAFRGCHVHPGILPPPPSNSFGCSRRLLVAIHPGAHPLPPHFLLRNSPLCHSSRPLALSFFLLPPHPARPASRSLILHWTPNPTSIAFAMEAQPNSGAESGWLGIGWSPDGTMIAADSVIGNLPGNQVQTWYLADYTQDTFTAENLVLGRYGSRMAANGTLMWYVGASRPLAQRLFLSVLCFSVCSTFRESQAQAVAAFFKTVCRFPFQDLSPEKHSQSKLVSGSLSSSDQWHCILALAAV